MKFSLCFQVYNKAHWVESLLASWHDTASGENALEFVVVFDDCRDGSPAVAYRTLQERGADFLFLYARDEYEVYCNQMAADRASGDFVIFIQDDNWMHDKGWDETLRDVLRRTPEVGVVGLLAGLRFDRKAKHHRLEFDRPHKGANFWTVLDGEFGVWQVDAICRPFGLRLDLFRQVGGLDFAYRPMDWDDADLGVRLLREGYRNLYVPFDVVNLVTKTGTIGEKKLSESYAAGRREFRRRHADWLAKREGTSLRKLYDVTEEPLGGLYLCE